MKLAPVFIAFLLLAASCAAQQYAPDHLIVKYRSAEYSTASEKLFHEKELSGIALVELPKGADVIKAAKEYRKMPDVEYAEPDYILTAFIVPNDASFSEQQDEYAAVALETAWNITTGSRDVVIAIIDTGVDWDHPDLSANIWNNTAEIAGNSVDDDGNGYVDDVRGYDFVSSPSDCDSGDDCSTRDNNPMDRHGHGTHVAGIAAAVANNSIGVAGACWNCTIMPIRAGYNGTDGLGHLTASDVALAIVYAANNSADIISMSFGGTNNVLILQDAIEFAASKGSILVAAAGNSYSEAKFYPAAYDSVISVAGTDNSDAKYANSQYGSWVDLAAPALDIYSTYFDDTYDTLSGTSMAAPMVAGVIGLMKSYDSSLDSALALQILNSTGRVLSNFGAPGLNMVRINATAALQLPTAAVLATRSNISGILLINSSVNAIAQIISVNASILNSAGIAVSLIPSLGSGTNHSGYWNVSFNTSLIPDGNYNLSINATNALNISGISEYVSIAIDNTKPNVSTVIPLNNSVFDDQSFLVNASVNDSVTGIFNASFRLASPGSTTAWIYASIGSGSIMQGYWNASINSTSLANGVYDITINATDYAGNHQVINISQIQVANIVPPNVTILFPRQDMNISDNLLVNASINDSGTVASARVTLLNSAGNATSWSSMTLRIGTTSSGYWDATIATASLMDGYYNVSINATNSMGNTNISGNISIAIDNTPPLVSIIAPVNGTNASGIMLINASLDDSGTGVISSVFRIISSSVSSIWIIASRDVGSITQSFWNASFSSLALPDGFYNITINATNYAGKSSLANVSQIRIDNTKPNSSVIVPPSDSNLTGIVLINVSANDSSGISNVSFRVASPNNSTDWIISTSGAAGYWNASFNFSTLADGIYNLTVYAADFAGNANISNSTLRVNSTPADAAVLQTDNSGSNDEGSSSSGTSSGSSGSGGGGGGGFYGTWNCTEWSECSPAGTQARKCTNSKSQYMTAGKPAESQNCAYVAPKPVVSENSTMEATVTAPSEEPQLSPESNAPTEEQPGFAAATGMATSEVAKPSIWATALALLIICGLGFAVFLHNRGKSSRRRR
ncbi:MAG: S8 family serine peptidase [Candidatus Woesearchaeota archaeon]